MRLAIGDFSRATHMSIKTLHHYHRIGLLEPAEIDEETGYRRYSVDQIPTAQVIRRFRDLDMPLDEIRAVLSASEVEGRDAVIAAHLLRLEGSLERTRGAIASLRDLLEASASAPFPVERRRVETIPAAVISDVVEVAELSPWFQGAMADVSTHALAVDGPIREHYLIGRLDTDDVDAWRTEIAWPIFRTGAG